MRSVTSYLALSLVILTACPKGQDGPADPGGGRACTTIGCVDGLHLELDHPGAWAPGAYSFEVVVDGTTVTCSGALPLKGCDDGPSLACDVADRVVIGESGCALAADQQGFADVHVAGAPAEWKVTIRRDGAVIAESSGAPKYVESRPNGPECEPLCRSANERIAVP